MILAQLAAVQYPKMIDLGKRLWSQCPWYLGDLHHSVCLENLTILNIEACAKFYFYKLRPFDKINSANDKWLMFWAQVHYTWRHGTMSYHRIYCVFRGPRRWFRTIGRRISFVGIAFGGWLPNFFRHSINILPKDAISEMLTEVTSRKTTDERMCAEATDRASISACFHLKH